MIQKPKISVVIVCLNSEKTIKQAIESIIRQDYPFYEIIIKDGLSTDGTLDVIRSFGRQITRLESGPDSGVYDAMNEALTMCTGHYVFFLGADDEIYSDTVFKDMFTGVHNARAILYGNVIFTGSGKVRYGEMNAYTFSKHNLCHQSVFYPRSVFDHHQYDVKYKIMADYRLNLELYFNSDYLFCYKDIIVAKFNDTGLSQSAKDYVFEKEKNDLIKALVPKFTYFRYVLRLIFKKIKG